MVDGWLASSGVNVNSSNANFGPGAANEGNVNCGNSNLFNSDGNENNNGLGVLPVDSINCGYIINDYIRDNIETNHSPFAVSDKLKIDKYIC